jgi:hypothetical protein
MGLPLDLPISLKELLMVLANASVRPGLCFKSVAQRAAARIGSSRIDMKTTAKTDV